MDARLDMAGGRPVLRLENTGGFGNRRAVFDLPLTAEQAKQIEINTTVGGWPCR